MAEGWTEHDSELYRRIGRIAVPDRDWQIGVLLTLIPFATTDAFRVLELGCGEGLLAEAVLTAFPAARYTALDGSESMRAAAGERLARFEGRASVHPFEIASTDWLPLADGAGAVLASLSVHHVPDKAALYRELAGRLDENGAVLLADVVAPSHPLAHGLYADAYDEMAERQSVRKTGDRELFHEFQRAEWNHLRFPDPEELPSPLADQLDWLRQGGFAVADCFWQFPGHAVYGGYRTAAPSAPSPRLSLANALAVARAVLAES